MNEVASLFRAFSMFTGNLSFIRLIKNLFLFCVIMMVPLIILSNNVEIIAYNHSTAIGTLEIDRVKIMEDRDTGGGEVYVKVTINETSPQLSYIYKNVNDGDEVQLNWIVFSGNFSFVNVSIEVWESDDHYIEFKNDFLGGVFLIWDENSTIDSWYDCERPIGGKNSLQAQVYIRSHLGLVSFPPVVPTNQIDIFSLVGSIIGLVFFLIFLFGLALFVYRRFQSKKKQTIFTPTEKPFTKVVRKPFFCQVDGQKHPATDKAFQCIQCSRFVCENCYNAMSEVGMAVCPMCEGELKRVKE